MRWCLLRARFSYARIRLSQFGIVFLILWYRTRLSAMRTLSPACVNLGRTRTFAQAWQRLLICELFSHLTHYYHTERELSNHHAIKLRVIAPVSSRLKHLLFPTFALLSRISSVLRFLNVNYLLLAPDLPLSECSLPRLSFLFSA